MSLEQIEIQNASDWSEVRLSDFKLRVGNRVDRVLSHNSTTSYSDKGSDCTQKFDLSISVTLHQYVEFMKIYDLFHIDIGIIETSLLPANNRE